MINTVTPRPTRVAPRGTESRGDLILVVAAPVSAALVVTGTCPLLLHLVAGLFLLIVLPVVLVNAKINWPESTKLHESLAVFARAGSAWADGRRPSHQRGTAVHRRSATA